MDMTTLTKKYNVKYVINLDEELKQQVQYLIFDFYKIKQAVCNMLSNSFKFSPQNGLVQLNITQEFNEILIPKINSPTLNTVSMSSRITSSIRSSISGSISNDDTLELNTLKYKIPNKALKFLQFQVIDNGVGISEEKQKVLFQEYTQINSNNLQHGEGMGLGLNITKKIVDQHNGLIEYFYEPPTETSLGRSIFNIKIPFVYGDRTAFERSLSGISKVYPIKERLYTDVLCKTKATCLVVDDTITITKLMIKMLKNNNINAISANSGADAIKIMKSPLGINIKLILIDYDMPHMMGDEAIRNIRKINHPDLIILAVTGNALPEYQSILLNSGANSILCKPIDFNILEKELEKQFV